MNTHSSGCRSAAAAIAAVSRALGRARAASAPSAPWTCAREHVWRAHARGRRPVTTCSRHARVPAIRATTLPRAAPSRAPLGAAPRAAALAATTRSAALTPAGPRPPGPRGSWAAPPAGTASAIRRCLRAFPGGGVPRALLLSAGLCWRIAGACCGWPSRPRSAFNPTAAAGRCRPAARSPQCARPARATAAPSARRRRPRPGSPATPRMLSSAPAIGAEIADDKLLQRMTHA